MTEKAIPLGLVAISSHRACTSITGVSVLALKNIIERANRLGLDHTPISEEEARLLFRAIIIASSFVWEMKDKEHDLNHVLAIIIKIIVVVA